MILVTMGSVSADILYTPGEDKKKSLKKCYNVLSIKRAIIYRNSGKMAIVRSMSYVSSSK